MNQLLPVNTQFSNAAVDRNPAPTVAAGNHFFNGNQSIQSNIVMLLIMLIQQLLTQIGQQQGQQGQSSSQNQGQTLDRQPNTGAQDHQSTDNAVQRAPEDAQSAPQAVATQPIVAAPVQAVATAPDPAPLPRPQPVPAEETKPTVPAQLVEAQTVALPLPRPEPLPTEVTKPTLPTQLTEGTVVAVPQPLPAEVTKPTVPAQVTEAAAVATPVATTQPVITAPQPAPVAEPVTQPGQKVIDVYLLGGQSNAKLMGGERLESALENALGQDTDGHRTEVFAHAVGGTSLHNHWKADGTANRKGDGDSYGKFQLGLDAYLTKLRAANPDAQINIKGMFWHQGESDSTSSSALQQAYDENLTRLIQDVRATTGVDDLRFMIGRLSENQSDAPGIRVIQQAQDAVAAADTNVVAVNMDTAEAAGIHFTEQGYDTMAQLFAESYRGHFS